MSVAVIVPFRGGCPHREAAWAWVQARYASEHPGWTVIEGEPPAGPWCKARAITAGLAHTTADILVVADADVWVDNLAEAVALLDEHPVVVPHSLVRRLDQRSTRARLAQHPIAESYDRRPYIGRMCGGVTVLRRETWQQVPMDPRFLNWGQEDDSWCIAITTLLGKPKRLTADLLHLWHPPQARKNPCTGSKDGRALQRRYETVAHDPDAMRALLAEFAEEMAA